MLWDMENTNKDAMRDDDRYFKYRINKPRQR